MEMKVEINPRRWRPKCGLIPGSETNLMVSAGEQHRAYEVVVCYNVFKATVPW